MTARIDVAADVAADAVDVAVGILVRDDGSYLLAQRPAGKPMAGWWEFPGGKLEGGESVFEALVREFEEELGLSIVTAHPWAQRVVVYPHATVRLHFRRSFGEGRGWRGLPTSKEGQAFRWEHIERSTAEPWLEGAEPIKRWLRLPATYAISNASAVGTSTFLTNLDRQLAAGAIRQLQLREPGMDEASFDALFETVDARCRVHAVRLVVNSAHPERYWSRASGVHLTSRALMRIDRRPDVEWCFASCHDRREIARVGELAIDAAVLGPVRPTASHREAKGIGWSGFADAIANTTCPVYAIGGLMQIDLGRALASGAHGVAMIRGAWHADAAQAG